MLAWFHLCATIIPQALPKYNFALLTWRRWRCGKWQWCASCHVLINCIFVFGVLIFFCRIHPYLFILTHCTHFSQSFSHECPSPHTPHMFPVTMFYLIMIRCVRFSQWINNTWHLMFEWAFCLRVEFAWSLVIRTRKSFIISNFIVPYLLLGTSSSRALLLILPFTGVGLLVRRCVWLFEGEYAECNVRVFVCYIKFVFFAFFFFLFFFFVVGVFQTTDGCQLDFVLCISKMPRKLLFSAVLLILCHAYRVHIVSFWIRNKH